MPFEFEPLALSGVTLVRPRMFNDARGGFLESFRASDFVRAGLPHSFVQDNLSWSKRGVLRGLHYQLPPKAQGKLVHVLQGKVFDVCVDLRRGSEAFGRWLGVELSDENRHLLYVPPGFGHGFVALSESVLFSYRCTAEYDPALERGVRFDDPDLAVTWPMGELTISERDRGLPTLRQAQLFEDSAQ